LPSSICIFSSSTLCYAAGFLAEASFLAGNFFVDSDLAGVYFLADIGFEVYFGIVSCCKASFYFGAATSFLGVVAFYFSR